MEIGHRVKSKSLAISTDNGRAHIAHRKKNKIETRSMLCGGRGWWWKRDIIIIIKKQKEAKKKRVILLFMQRRLLNCVSSDRLMMVKG